MLRIDLLMILDIALIIIKLSKLGWKPSVKVEDKIFEINDWYIKNLKDIVKDFNENFDSC